MSRKTYTVRGRECEPVDAVAARAMSGGAHYTPEWRKPPHTMDAPLPTIPYPNREADLTGSVNGSMRILGYLGRDKWLARCVCGKYERRQGIMWRRNLRDGKAGGPCCFCDRREHIKAVGHGLQHGVWPGGAPFTERQAHPPATQNNDAPSTGSAFSPSADAGADMRKMEGDE